MYEVELKVRAAHNPVREKLSALDATALESVHQDDIYYDAPHRSFAETDEALRLRLETAEKGTFNLTYKGPLVESASKTREERETVVKDGEEMDTILTALGFVPAAAVEKERETFGYEGYTIALDTVDGLGEFVEVEREASENDIEHVRDGARDLLLTLDCNPDEQIRTSYLELLSESDSAASGDNFG